MEPLKLTEVVKAVKTKSYEIVMVKSIFNEYYIVYESDDKTIKSAPITSYEVASYYFDSKRRELEGH